MMCLPPCSTGYPAATMVRNYDDVVNNFGGDVGSAGFPT